LRKLTPKNHGLEVEEKQEKQKQNICQWPQMIIILKTITKYNIPKVYSEIIDIYPKDCIFYINVLLIFKKKITVKTLTKFSSFFKRYLWREFLSYLMHDVAHDLVKNDKGTIHLMMMEFWVWWPPRSACTLGRNDRFILLYGESFMNRKSNPLMKGTPKPVFTRHT